MNTAGASFIKEPWPTSIRLLDVNRGRQVSPYGIPNRNRSHRQWMNLEIVPLCLNKKRNRNQAFTKTNTSRRPPRASSRYKIVGRAMKKWSTSDSPTFPRSNEWAVIAIVAVVWIILLVVLGAYMDRSDSQSATRAKLCSPDTCLHECPREYQQAFAKTSHIVVARFHEVIRGFDHRVRRYGYVIGGRV